MAFLNRPDIDGHLLDDPVQFANDHGGEFTDLFEDYTEAIEAALGNGGEPLWKAFVEHTEGWTSDNRKALLARYFGFPLWDGLIFPTIALSELPQFTPIGVAQFSPLAAKALTPLGKDKLQGIPLHHFAGFTKIESRANDYLWGRLDGVELILRTLYRSVVLDPIGGGDRADGRRQGSGGDRRRQGPAGRAAGGTRLRRPPGRAGCDGARSARGCGVEPVEQDGGDPLDRAAGER